MISVSESLTELRNLAGRDPAAAEERAAHEFEAMILSEMLKTGSKPMLGESLLDGGSAGRTAREQLYSQLVLVATRGSALGLAEQLGLSNAESETREPDET